MSGDEQLHWMGDVKELLPPVSDSEYLRWQLERQLAQEVTDPKEQRAINEWLFAAAQVLSVPELSQAMGEYRVLCLPAGHYFVRPRRAAAFATALSLCLNGMQRQPAYKEVFIQLYRNLLRSELRDAQNRPGAAIEVRQAALDHYDARLADLNA
jgi:hypothetical protein